MYEYLKELDPAFYEMMANRDPLEHRGRTFRELTVSPEHALSIQGSGFHYCSPKIKTSPENYESMEMAFFYRGAMCKAAKVIKDPKLLAAVEEYYSNPVYSFVPVQLIEEIYQHTKNHYSQLD